MVFDVDLPRFGWSEKADQFTAYAERLYTLIWKTDVTRNRNRTVDFKTSKLGDEKPLNQAINRSLPELQRWMPWANDPSMQPTIRYVKEGITALHQLSCLLITSSSIRQPS